MPNGAGITTNVRAAAINGISTQMVSVLQFLTIVKLMIQLLELVLLVSQDMVLIMEFAVFQ